MASRNFGSCEKSSLAADHVHREPRHTQPLVAGRIDVADFSDRGGPAAAGAGSRAAADRSAPRADPRVFARPTRADARARARISRSVSPRRAPSRVAHARAKPCSPGTKSRCCTRPLTMSAPLTSSTSATAYLRKRPPRRISRSPFGSQKQLTHSSICPRGRRLPARPYLITGRRAAGSIPAWRAQACSPS